MWKVLLTYVILAEAINLARIVVDCSIKVCFHIALCVCVCVCVRPAKYWPQKDALYALSVSDETSQFL